MFKFTPAQDYKYTVVYYSGVNRGTLDYVDFNYWFEVQRFLDRIGFYAVAVVNTQLNLVIG